MGLDRHHRRRLQRRARRRRSRGPRRDQAVAVLELEEPIDRGGRELRRLHFRRARLEDSGGAFLQGEMDCALASMSHLTGQPVEVLEELALADFASAVKITTELFEQLSRNVGIQPGRT